MHEDGTSVTNFSVGTHEASARRLRPSSAEDLSRAVVSKERVADCPQGWKKSPSGEHWELTTWFRVTAWRTLAETTNQWLAKGRQVYVEGELNGEAENGVQNPRVWAGNDGVAKASFEITARTVKFLGSAEGNGGAPVGEPPPEGYEEDSLPF